MTLCQFYAACAEETIEVTLTVKERIERMIQDKIYDRNKLREEEQVICRALDELCVCMQGIEERHLADQIKLLKVFTIQSFLQMSGGIDEDKLKKLCGYLEELHHKIDSVSLEEKEEKKDVS